MHPYPHHYELSVTATEGRMRSFTVKSGSFDPIISSVPDTFGGPNSGWSPEHLLAASLCACFTTTLKGISERKKLNFDRLTLQADLVLDRVDKGIAFQELRVRGQISGVSSEQKEAIMEAIRGAEAHCLVSRAINFPTVYDIKFVD